MNNKDSLFETERGLDSDMSAEAIYTLAVSFAAGTHGIVDYAQAHKWFNIAASMGYEDAVVQRREIAEYMSKSEIRAAQKEARAWLLSFKKVAA